MEKLYQLLYSLKDGTGDFACSGFLPELSLPGLVIENVGHVSLPVQEEQALKIIEVAKKAPFGLGAQTLIDETVRKTWQLEPSQITIKNDHFIAGVENVVSAVKKHLGCNKKAVQANLYKVLLYEKGGHFKAHRDTEKEKGMFATMVIQLPSKFEGGKLTVCHAGQEKVIEMDGERSTYCCKYAAHYCDCQHEVSAINSGYRLALVYSLCWTSPGDPPSADALKAIVEKVSKVLPKICVGQRNLFAWFLSHKYSKSGLSGRGIDALKGGDEAVVRALQQANELLPTEQRFEFHLAEVNRELQQFGDFDGEDSWDSDGEFEPNGDEEEEISIENWFKLDGTPTDLQLDGAALDIEGDVVNFKKPNNMPLKEAIEQLWGKADSEDNTGPTGNEGATQTYWYSSYAIFAWQKDNAVNLMCKLSGYTTGVKWISDELEKVEKLDLSSPACKKAMSDLKTVIDFGVSNDVSLSEDAVSVMLRTLTNLRSDAISLTNRFITDVMVKHNSSKSGTCLGERHIIMPLIQLTVKFGWPSVSESLQKLFDLSPVFQHGWWAEFLKSLFQESKDKQMLREDACFKSIIACLAERIEADAENNQLESATTENRVEEVASLLFVFGNDIILAKFTNAILACCRQSPKCTVLQNLIRFLEKEKLSGNQFWIQLLNLRIVQLVDVEKEEMPPFTWNQDDAVLNGHPQVQAFLRGPNQTMKYQEFTNIAQARSFASTFFGPLRRWSWAFMNTSSRSYTATAKTGGSGRRAYCLIEKTREWYDKKVAPLKQQLEELKKLRNMVNPVPVPVSSLTTEQEEPPAKKRAYVSVECID